MKSTHRLAFWGDMLCAAVPLGEDLDEAVREECPLDVAEGYEEEGFTVDVFLSDDELDDEECVYSGNRHGWLPDNRKFAYRGEE